MNVNERANASEHGGRGFFGCLFFYFLFSIIFFLPLFLVLRITILRYELKEEHRGCQ